MKNYFQAKNFLFLGALLVLVIGGLYFNSTPTKVEAGCWVEDPSGGGGTTQWPTPPTPIYYNGVQVGSCHQNCNTNLEPICFCSNGYHLDPDNPQSCVPNSTGMYGDLSPNTSTCSIPVGQSRCSSTLSWTTTNPVATSSVTNSGGATPNPGPSINNSSQAFSIPYTPSNSLATFTLKNNGVTLDSVVADARCISGSSWDGTKCVASSPGPDLTAFSASPNTAPINQPQIFSALISNIGDEIAGKETTGPGGNTLYGPFPYFFQIADGSNGAGSMHDLTSSTTAALGPGASRIVNSPAYTFSTAGTYSVRVCADKTNSSGGGVVVESNENNNCGPWVNVTASVPAPDLTASTPTTTDPTVPGPINFRSTIANVGNVSTNSSFTNKFQTSPVSDGSSGVVDYPVTPNMSTLIAGSTAISSKSITLPPGTIYIRACADLPPYNFGVIVESNENNNCSSSWVPVIVNCPTGTGWNQATSSCVVNDISVTLSANPISVVLPGNSTRLTWATVGSPTSCTASGAWNGVKSSSGSFEDIAGLTTAGSPYIYTIKCSKTGSFDVTSTVEVTVNPVNPTVNGACGLNPQNPTHYNCSVGTDDLSSHRNYPSRVTWTCNGINGGGSSPLCVEQKGPGFIEN